MPGMNGKVLADRLRGLRPELRVVFMSGYSDGILQQRGIVGNDVSFLQKPFHLAALAQKVRHLLSSQADGFAALRMQAKEPPGKEVSAVDWDAEIEALETHLGAIEQAAARTPVSREVLTELRSALDHCRTTLWAAAVGTEVKRSD